MSYFDPIRVMEQKEFVEKLENCTVKDFCETVPEIVREFKRKHSHRGNIPYFDLIVSLSTSLEDRTKTNLDLKTRELGGREFSDVLWIMDKLFTLMVVKHPPESITYTTPKKFFDRMEKIRKDQS